MPAQGVRDPVTRPVGLVAANVESVGDAQERVRQPGIVVVQDADLDVAANAPVHRGVAVHRHDHRLDRMRGYALFQKPLERAVIGIDPGLALRRGQAGVAGNVVDLAALGDRVMGLWRAIAIVGEAGNVGAHVDRV